MTKEEAIIYLPIGEEEDVQDIYDEKLFELKQFFLNRFPVSKLIQSRLSKFSRVENAFQVLGGEVTRSVIKQEVTYEKFASLRPLFAWYNIEKNKLRLQLTASSSYADVSTVLDRYLELTRFYAQHWIVPLLESDSAEIKIGVEPNPMDIQQALNEIEESETVDSEYILSLPDDNCLKSEAKRLSLWLNFEINEQSIR